MARTHVGSKSLTASLSKTLCNFKCAPLPLRACLLSDDHVQVHHAERDTKRAKKNDLLWHDDYNKSVSQLGGSNVASNLKKLMDTELPHLLLDRELKVLAVAVTHLQTLGYDPFATIFVVQIDQNFMRGYIRSNPSLCPCITPKGRYILTSKWRQLCAEASNNFLKGHKRAVHCTYPLQSLIIPYKAVFSKRHWPQPSWSGKTDAPWSFAR
jgi:hypothetical protein